MAFVIQGPLDPCDDFTLETVRFYRIYYPDVTIIVSTWDDEDQDYIRKLEAAGAIIVLSRYPDSCGRGNANYQCVSSLAGIRRAKELGIQYVFRNRSDMRIYRRDALEYMYCLLEQFPVMKQDCKGYIPSRRILAEGFMFDPYWIQDFYYFGEINDMLCFFSMPLDTSKEWIELKDHKKRENYSRMAFCDIFAPSLYYTKAYVRSLEDNSEIQNSVKAYWDVVKKYFICVGWEELEAYWHKYDIRYSMNQRQSIYAPDDRLEQPKYKWRFSNWLNLYCDSIEYREEFEKFKENNWKS